VAPLDATGLLVRCSKPAQNATRYFWRGGGWRSRCGLAEMVSLGVVAAKLRYEVERGHHCICCTRVCRGDREPSQ